MTIAKKAQYSVPEDWAFMNAADDSEEYEVELDHALPQLADDSEREEEVDDTFLYELEEGSGEGEIVFLVPEIPGADGEDLDFGLEVDEPEEEIEVEEKDPWDWQSLGLGSFLTWLSGMIENTPRHTGRDTTGIEKVIAYFEALNKEISKAMRSDYRNEIDSAKAEEARAQIEDGLERLIDRLEKLRITKYKRHAKNKKAGYSAEFVKEGQKATHVGGIVVTVPLLISTIARACINGTVSAGHDIEDSFKKFSDMYKLSTREKAEVIQLMSDMGYPIRRDRGVLLDEEINTTSSDNVDWAANFPS